MKLYLVRHGETDWNVHRKIQGSTDTELNETGVAQAKALANVLADADLSLARVYSSRQKRALMTAQIAAQRLDLPVVPLDGLEEICFGLWEGLTWQEVPMRFPAEHATWLASRRYAYPPQGESYQDVLERFLAALRLIASQNTQDVLIVTHSANIMVLLSALQNKPFEQMVENFKIPNAQAIAIDALQLSTP